MNPAELPKYRYRVDAQDQLIWVDSWWLAFARENGAPELTKANVEGRPLWDFVAGTETQQVYQQLHERLRTHATQAVIPFRCDSPSIERHCHMTIRCERGGVLLYESVVDRAIPRHRIDLIDATTPRSTSFLTMCSCCERALIEPKGWLSMENIAPRLGVLQRDVDALPRLRYAICPECRVALSRISAGAELN